MTIESLDSRMARMEIEMRHGPIDARVGFLQEAVSFLAATAVAALRAIGITPAIVIF
jgi:hypothetical protein